jgi:osmoprotectant transport system permease protein
LSILAIAIGTAISIPLAVLAWRFRVVRAPVFGIASTLYIIPSLALFAILGPITGFVASYTTAEIALVGYTLLILIWNTVAGLDAVPQDAREAATAMGYSPTAALIKVDVPLALPYIFAGLRVATATIIGLVTVTALIGLGGLGQQITYGFNVDYNTPIIVGLVLSIALAAVADLLLVGAQRLAVPWARTRRGQES